MQVPPATHVVLLTPAGRGAIASLMVAGPDAAACLDQLFFAANGAPASKHPLRRIALGRWADRVQGEEVILGRMADDRFEVHCHGGRAAPAAIIESLVERGCREITWREWIHAEAHSVLSAQAREALADARSERTATILWDQYCGSLEKALASIVARVAAHDPDAACRELDALLCFAPLGLHLTRPWRVALAGPANVGKSSLVNALVGYARSIVDPAPGTTRDVVSSTSVLDGWPVEFLDTAGLRTACDPLEAAGIRLARKWLATADLVVLVHDASQGDRPQQSLLDEWPTALVVGNKCDLLASPSTSHDPAGVLYTSATRGDGVLDLQEAIVARLVPRVPAAGGAVPFTLAQVEGLTQARSAAEQGDWRLAARSIEALTGGHGGC